MIPIVIMAAILMTTVGLSYYTASQNAYRMARFRTHRAQAFYLAESALAHAEKVIVRDAPSKEVQGEISLETGVASYRIWPTSDTTGTYEIFCRGTASESGRTPVTARIETLQQLTSSPEGVKRLEMLARKDS